MEDGRIVILIGWIGIAFILYLIVKYGVRAGSRLDNEDESPPIARPTGRGVYVVGGVDRATGADKSLHLIADTAANAKAKGQLKGMIVTSVDFLK